MLDCTLKQMAVFEAIMVTGTVGGAADKLGMTQPAASQALAEWEKRTGGSCFDRLGKRLVPNTRGLSLLASAQKVLDSARDLESELAGHPSKDLWLAASPVIIDFLLDEDFKNTLSEPISIRWLALHNDNIPPEAHIVFSHALNIGQDYQSELYADMWFLPIGPKNPSGDKKWYITKEQENFPFFISKTYVSLPIPYETLSRLVASNLCQALVPEFYARRFLETKQIRLLQDERVKLAVYKHTKLFDKQSL